MVRHLGTIPVAKHKTASERRRRNHARTDSTGRREHARNQARPFGVGEGRADAERDAGRGGRRDHRRGPL